MVRLPSQQILVDIVEHKEEEGSCSAFSSAVDICSHLRQHKRCVLFGLPGAFTPTCSAQHLPDFIRHAQELAAAGVEAVYCLSVNDKFVMQAWFASTAGCADSGIKLIADGNGELSKSLDLLVDETPYRMGYRCQRFAALLQDGEIVTMHVDEDATKTSPQVILNDLEKL